MYIINLNQTQHTFIHKTFSLVFYVVHYDCSVPDFLKRLVNELDNSGITFPIKLYIQINRFFNLTYFIK